MKLDLYLERQGGLVLIAWARETVFGVYMGVRFSPEVENASYFKDGQLQLLRFPLMANGKRKREEIPLECRSPIPEIQEAELILGRTVKVAGETPSNPPAPQRSAGTTAITIAGEYVADYPFLYYEAHIVRNGYTEQFIAAKKRDSMAGGDDESFSMRLFPLDFFPERSLALMIQRQRSRLRSSGSLPGK